MIGQEGLRQAEMVTVYLSWPPMTVPTPTLLQEGCCASTQAAVTCGSSSTRPKSKPSAVLSPGYSALPRPPGLAKEHMQLSAQHSFHPVTCPLHQPLTGVKRLR